MENIWPYNSYKNVMGGVEGNNPSGIRRFDMIFSVLITLCGALFFLFVTRSITGVAHSTWIVPIIASVIFLSFLSVFSITVGIKKMIAPITMISFLPSIIFMPDLAHICVVAMMMLVAMHGLYVMRHTLFNIMKIDIGMIVRSGILYVSFAIIVTVTSQYYFHIRGDENFVFDIDKHTTLSNSVTEYILEKSTVKDVSVNTMTVDEFLVLIIQNTDAQDKKLQGPVIPQEDEGMIIRWTGNVTGVTNGVIKEKAQELVLAQMRKNMSTMLGRDVSGEELISDVLADVIEMQINQLMQKNAIMREHQMEIFAGTFFVVLLSMVPFIRVFIGFFTWLVFVTLRELKIVHITKTQRDAEVIVF